MRTVLTVISLLWLTIMAGCTGMTVGAASGEEPKEVDLNLDGSSSTDDATGAPEDTSAGADGGAPEEAAAGADNTETSAGAEPEPTPDLVPPPLPPPLPPPPPVNGAGHPLGPRPPDASQEQPTESAAPAPDEVAAAPDQAAGEVARDREALEQFRVRLSVEEHMTLPGPPGELRVWIGDPDYDAAPASDMATDTTDIPALGQAARVEPFAPAFTLAPPRTECIRIHPSGSEVQFQLTPTDTGVFKVGATVYLFADAGCQGTPIPKSAATLQVEVAVNTAKVVKERSGELGQVAWEKFLEFWGAAVALILAAVLFLLRKTLKRWFGFESG